MVYAFDHTDTIEAQLRTIAGYQIGEALSALDCSKKKRAVGVHAVRKRCKKLRGLIRIVRPVFADYKEENATFRKIAHLFDDLRDAQVALDTFDLLTKNCKVQVDTRAFVSLSREIIAQRKEIVSDPDWQDRRKQAQALLKKSRKRSKKWSLSAESWDALRGGVEMTYGRARQARDAVIEEPSALNHHLWRKRAKYHWCHTLLIKRAFPEILKPYASLLDELTDDLGKHHDIHVFSELLRGEARPFTDEDALATLLAAADSRSALLETKAERLGAKLFADETIALSNRWTIWWQTWQAEDREAHAT